MNLFLQELKITLKSLTYWVVIAMIGLFTFTQLGGDLTTITEPQPNGDGYGRGIIEDKEAIQEQTYGLLFISYLNDNYETYPLGFVKEVNPSEADKEAIKNILENASGMSISEIENDFDGESAEQAMSDEYYLQVGYDMPLKKGHTYQQFEKDMLHIEEILGAGSDFSKDKYTNMMGPMTYEQAMENYRLIVEKDHVSGAYARMVVDYFGIILALVPVFLGATVMLRDKRSKAQALIFTKQSSTIKIVLTRYLSTVLLLIVPVLIFSLMPALQVGVIADKLGVTSDLFLFYRYIFLWLTPTILAVVGLSFLITELFGGIIAVIFQIALWFSNLLLAKSLLGYVGWSLIPRFNYVGNTKVFEAILPQLINNRIFWSVLGILCLIATILLADFKRKGGFHFGKKH